MENISQYVCPKCSNITCETEQFDSDVVSQLFGTGHSSYVAVTCTRCGYTEFYKNKDNNGQNMYGFFLF